MSPKAKTSAALIPLSLDQGRTLREFFAEAGYNLENLRGGLGFTDLSSFRYRKYLLAQDAEPPRLEVIVQWFTCGIPVSVEKAKRVIPDWVISMLVDCGLLIPENDSLRPEAMLSPFDDLLVASDLTSKLEGDASDLIVWPNATTYQMRNAALLRSCDSALDLGCGTGALAVKLASHARSVTAADLNPRAAVFTAFNASLNGLDNIECITGDAFAPLAGRKFDLILCNPPFFLVPSSGLMYCENPMELDSFARFLMRQAARHLNEFGFFQMLCEWVDLKEQPWRERLLEWGEGLGCDVWILKTYTMTPVSYGKERCEQRPGDRAAGDAAFARWVEYYRAKQVEAVHGGLVMLRRRTGKNWVRLEEDAAVTLAHPMDELLLDGFAARDLLQLSDQELLAIQPRLVDRARLRQLLQREGSKWTQSRLTLTAPGGFGSDQDATPIVAEFVGKFDGTRTLRELISALAKIADADLEKVTAECLEITRHLLERGFIVKAIE